MQGILKALGLLTGGVVVATLKAPVAHAYPGGCTQFGSDRSSEAQEEAAAAKTFKEKSARKNCEEVWKEAIAHNYKLWIDNYVNGAISAGFFPKLEGAHMRLNEANREAEKALIQCVERAGRVKKGGK
jgi:hypothetical protein